MNDSAPAFKGVRLVMYMACGDFHEWAASQSAALRGRDCGPVDARGIAETLDRLVREETDMVLGLVRDVLSAMAEHEFGPPAGRMRALGRAARGGARLGRLITPTMATRVRPRMASLWESAAAGIGGRCPPCCPYSWEDVFGAGPRFPR